MSPLFSVAIDSIFFKVEGIKDIISCMSSNFGKIGQLTMELWSLHFFSVSINPILFKLASKKFWKTSNFG